MVSVTTRNSRESAAHRSQRRSRTRARTLLRHFVDTREGAPGQINRAITVLQAHHSSSELPHRARQILQGKMSEYKWCWACYQYVTKKAKYCSQCGGKAVACYAEDQTGGSALESSALDTPWKAQHWTHTQSWASAPSPEPPPPLRSGKRSVGQCGLCRQAEAATASAVGRIAEGQGVCGEYGFQSQAGTYTPQAKTRRGRSRRGGCRDRPWEGPDLSLKRWKGPNRAFYRLRGGLHLAMDCQYFGGHA